MPVIPAAFPVMLMLAVPALMSAAVRLVKREPLPGEVAGQKSVPALEKLWLRPVR